MATKDAAEKVALIGCYGEVSQDLYKFLHMIANGKIVLESSEDSDEVRFSCEDVDLLAASVVTNFLHMLRTNVVVVESPMGKTGITYTLGMLGGRKQVWNQIKTDRWTFEAFDDEDNQVDEKRILKTPGEFIHQGKEEVTA